MRDQINTNDIVIHGSCPNIFDWPITKEIVTVEFRSGPSSNPECGVRVNFGTRDWPNINVPGVTNVIMKDGVNINPSGAGPDKLQFTLWVFIPLSGKWHGFGAIEFWQDRQWTGAPLLTQWHDWSYRTILANNHLIRGQEVAFCVAAGDSRFMDVRSVMERSNIVKVRLDNDVIINTRLSIPNPEPEPVPNPIPNPNPRIPTLEDFRRLESIIVNLLNTSDTLLNTIGNHTRAITDLEMENQKLNDKLNKAYINLYGVIRTNVRYE